MEKWVKKNKNEIKVMMNNKPIPTFEFIPQPPKSPDLNVLDLGIWNAVQSIVKEVQLLPGNYIQRDKMVVEVMKKWNKKCDQSSMIADIFDTLTKVRKTVVEFNGGNMFEIPHWRNKNDETVLLKLNCDF